MKLSCRGEYFVDEYGRVRLFKGINAVDKSVTFNEDGETVYSFCVDDEVLDGLNALGMNIIRLGVTWAGIEPEPGKISYTYLDGVKSAIKKAKEHGFEVFIDFHQDLFSKYLCTSGDGAPEYACEKPDWVKSKKPVVIWAEDYFLNPFVHKSFDEFWTEGSFTRNCFLSVLTQTAKYLSDCEIAAYDVMNEPFPGSPAKAVAASIVTNAAKTLLTNPRVDRKKLMADIKTGDVFKILSVIDDSKVFGSIVCPSAEIIKKFDETKYIPFLKEAEQALKRGGYNGVIFAENCYFSNLGIPCGLTKISDNMAFAPHGYDITVDTPITNTASPDRVDFIFDEHRRAQKRMGVPVIVGEWGGMVNGADDYPALRHLTEKYEKNYWSYTYWHVFDKMHESLIAKTMGGFYPIAVAGTPVKYENTAGRFCLTYTGDGKCEAPTEIFLAKTPKKVYSTAEYKIEGNRLYAEAKAGACIIVAEY